MHYYLTYNDGPSGVFKGQVVDVVSFLNKSFGLDIRLVAFVSLRNYRAAKRRIREWAPEAIVLPMVPKVRNWRLNRFLLRFALKRNTGFVIARGPFATALALDMRSSGRCKHVAYDGRGAFAAEWTEYDMGQDSTLKQMVGTLESRAVRESDFRLAVSKQLVNYWNREYDYQGQEHVVVPCTLNTGFVDDIRTARAKIRKQLGYSDQDVVMVYAGSTAGWQSFKLLEGLLTSVLERQTTAKLLFLSREEANNRAIRDRFPGRVTITWLAEEQVPYYLAACDYGILVRENSVTNQVAAPTKFAEYLHAGLRVLISEGLGDYSDFVAKNKCGEVLKPGQVPELVTGSQSLRDSISTLAERHFTKEAYKTEYGKLLEALSV